MKRSQFLATILGVVAAPFVAKEVIAKEEAKPVFDEKILRKRLRYLRQYPLTEKECLTPEQVLQMYSETGMLVWDRSKTKVEWIDIQP